ncbi:MAG TPA: hypothetical protein VGN98_10760 [Tianweitania sediminis]|jgi:catechol 2,3-dioxygenase|nr:hypothetical protein [Tianweitania sediminis]
MIEQDHISFGPVHLEVTDLSRTSMFGERLFGFVSRTGENDSVEIGAASETLIVLHAGARTPAQQGNSGLHHLAIHTPNERDFARLLKRFSDLRVIRLGCPCPGVLARRSLCK